MVLFHALASRSAGRDKPAAWYACASPHIRLCRIRNPRGRRAGGHLERRERVRILAVRVDPFGSRNAGSEGAGNVLAVYRAQPLTVVQEDCTYPRPIEGQVLLLAR